MIKIWYRWLYIKLDMNTALLRPYEMLELFLSNLGPMNELNICQS